MHSCLVAPLLSLAMLTAPLAAQSPPGACVLDDAAFTTRQGGCQDLGSNLTWSAPLLGAATWSYANSYCNGLVEGGVSDWRLPTLAELQLVDAAGAADHLRDIVVNGSYYWSGNPRGNKAYAYAFGTNQSALLVKASFVLVYCVRQGLPAGGAGFTGSSPLPRLRAMRVLANDQWTCSTIAPRLAQRPCFFVAGLTGPGNAMIVHSVPGMIDAGTGVLDAAGRTSVTVNLPALGLPAMMLQSLWLGLVVLEPTGPVLYDLSVE